MAAGPAAATISPATAGPTARARLTATPLSASADGKSRRPTSSGMIACQAGAFSALPVPTRKVNSRRLQTFAPPSSVSPPRAALARSIQLCVTIRSRRRSTTSASAPATNARRKTGSVVAAWTRAIRIGEMVRDVISQVAPTSCIQVPTFDASAASHRARNSGCLRGSQTGAAARVGAAAGAAERTVCECGSVIRTPGAVFPRPHDSPAGRPSRLRLALHSIVLMEATSRTVPRRP